MGQVPGKLMKNKRIIVFASALLLMIVSILSFSDDIFSPYVDFDYAKNNSNKMVQVIGKTDNKTIKTDKSGFSFTITDDNKNKMNIYHRGVKPLNFEHAEKVVLIGKYSNDHFVADKMLVKCPSKYTEKAK